MVTPEEYDRVQLILGRKGKPRKTKRAFAFTGAIHCEECGCLYTAEIKKKIIFTFKTLRFFFFNSDKQFLQ